MRIVLGSARAKSRMRPVEDQPCLTVIPSVHPGDGRRWCRWIVTSSRSWPWLLPPDGGKLEVFRIEPTSGRSVGSSASSRPSGAGCLLRGGARRVRAVAAVDEDGWLGCDVVARSLIPVHAGDRVKDRPPGREEARVACTGWGRGGSCMPPADPQSRAGPRSSDRDRQGAGQRRTARPARGVGIDDMPGDDT